MFNVQNYVRAASLEEAYELNQKKNARIIGGMLWLNMRSDSFGTAIDISGLGLDTIEETEDSFSIGAMVTLRQLELHESLNAYCGDAVRHAVRDIVGVQFRNMATIGGSIFGRYGFSDVLTVLMSMDCCVELYKGGIVPLDEFALMPVDNDILVRIIIRKRPGRYVYKAVRNQRTDFPVLNCAASAIEGEYRLVIGARPERAMLVRDADGILAAGITEASAEAMAEYAASVVPTGSNTRGSADYRTHLVRVLTLRSLMELGGER